MIKKLLIPLSLFFGVLWNILFWKTTPGVSYPIFIVVCLAGGWLLLRSEKRYPSWRSILLMALILIFAIFSFLRKDLFTIFTSYAMSLLLILLLASTYEDGEWIRLNLSGYFKKSLDLCGDLILLPIKFFSRKNDDKSDARAQKKAGLFWQIGRGLLLAIPVLLIFMLLLSSADLVFAQWTGNLLQSFNTESLLNWFTQGFLILLVAYGYTGLILTAQKNRSNDLPQDNPKKNEKQNFRFYRRCNSACLCDHIIQRLCRYPIQIFVFRSTECIDNRLYLFGICPAWIRRIDLGRYFQFDADQGNPGCVENG